MVTSLFEYIVIVPPLETTPLKVTEEGVVLAVKLPMAIVPAEVMVLRAKLPGEAVDFNVMAPDVVVVIDPPLIFIALAVMVTALLAPVIRPLLKVSVPEAVIVLAAPTLMVMLAEVRSKFTTETLPSKVAVPVPERESKNTLSAEVGRFPAPAEPPDEVAQWFVASDQFPVPPTQ